MFAKKILVTGGLGFIGSHLAHRLVSEGYEVTCADNFSTGKRGNLPQGCFLVEMDVTDYASFKALSDDGYDIVCHLGS